MASSHSPLRTFWWACSESRKSNCKFTLVWVEANSLNIGGKWCRPTWWLVATRSEPTISPDSSLMPRSIVLSSSSTASAFGSNSCPASVSCSSRPSRSSRRWFRLSSSFDMRLLMAGCVRNSFCAAIENEPDLATATKAVSDSVSMTLLYMNIIHVKDKNNEFELFGPTVKILVN